MAVAASRSKAPAAQPKRTIAATANTKVSESTPPPVSALIGTGKRSASVAAAVSAARLISARAPCAVVAKTYPAAIRTPRPARQTGTMRALSRRDVTACELTSGLEPGELFEGVPGELTRDCRDEHQDRHESNQLRLPLQHPGNNLPTRRRQTARFFLCARTGESPHRGI